MPTMLKGVSLLSFLWGLLFFYCLCMNTLCYFALTVGISDKFQHHIKLANDTMWVFIKIKFLLNFLNFTYCQNYLFSEKRQNADLLGNLKLMPLCWRHRDRGRGDLNFLLPGHVTAHPACLLWWRSHDNKLWKLNEWLPWKRSFLL